MALLAKGTGHSGSDETSDDSQPELVWIIKYRCGAEHRDRIKRLCRRRGVDQSAMVRALVEKALAREELEQLS